MTQHEKFMRRALALAAEGSELGEVPVGAVVVCDGEIIAEAFNQPIGLHDPTAHAEIQVLRQAGEKLGNYRLCDTSLYVTIEPCTMCVGAILHARVGCLVYGAPEPKMGAVESAFDLLGDKRHFHQLEVVPGVLAEECREQIQQFFKRRRMERAEQKRAIRGEGEQGDDS